MANILERGYLLHKRYRIVDTLGQGGMGSVYRAIDENLGVDVAVKENLFTTDEYARQFRLEAVILANLRHPNLPRVTDHFVIDGQGQYLIMDYIEGEDLRQRMERSGPVSEEEAVLIGTAMCEALSYLHSRKPSIIHRDLKPGNVRIAPDGHIYLVDFGLAKLVKGSQATTTGARAMTPGYSPPEQYGTARTDPRTDIYSLGATLYAAVTGIIPEDGLARAMDNVELTPVRKRAPRVSRKLSYAIEKAMSVRPDERFQNAEEFRQALLVSNIRTQRLETPPVMPAPLPDEEEEEQEAMAIPAAGAGEPPPSSPPSRPVKKRREWGRGFWVFASFFLLALLLGVIALVYFRTPLLQMVREVLAAETTQPPAQVTAVEPTAGEVTPGVTSAATLPGVLTLLPGPSPTPGGPEATLDPSLPTATLRGGGTGQLAIVSTRAGMPQVFLINADGSPLPDGSPMFQVTNMPDGACQPSWSPDGNHLVFIAPCEKRQDDYPEASLYIIRSDGTGLTELTVPGGGFEPAWSPDGKRIAFTSLVSGSFQVHIYNLANNQITVLTEKSNDASLPDWSRHPAWSPNSAQIVYTGHSQLTGAPQIWVMSDAGRGNRRLVLTDVTYWNFQPEWSPDGNAIWFSETLGAQALGWLMVYDYTDLADLDADQAPFGNYATDVAVSPDLRWLAFESTRYGVEFNVFLMTSDGLGRDRLTAEPVEEYDPAWRPLPPP